MIEISRSVLGHSISITAFPSGPDWNVIIFGGVSPHIGSVSLAENNNDVIQLNTIARFSHKDQIIGDHFAKELSRCLRCTVCVSCGIHFDNPTQNDLKEIISVSNSMLSELCQIL